MPRLPRITGRAMIKALVRAGFRVTRVRGSHHVLTHAGGRATVVPVPASETLGPGLIRSILADCRLDAEEIRGLL